MCTLRACLLPFIPSSPSGSPSRFGQPTEPQRLGWPEIAAGEHTLIAAPTGSGKTLAAFLVCIDRLLRQALDGELPDETQVVYVSPLKALSNDIQRNLQVPLAEIARSRPTPAGDLLPISRGRAHGRHAGAAAAGDAPQAAAHSGHHARIALSAAHRARAARCCGACGR